MSDSIKDTKIKIGGLLLTVSNVGVLLLTLIGGPLLYGGGGVWVVGSISEVFDFDVSLVKVFLIIASIVFVIVVWLVSGMARDMSKANRKDVQREYILDSPGYTLLQKQIKGLQDAGYFSSYEAKRLKQRIIDSV